MFKILDELTSGKTKQIINSSFLGVDIGTVSIKIVEINSQFNKLNLVNYGAIESSDYLLRSNSAIQTSSFSVADGDAVRMLKTLISQMGVKTKDVAATIPSFAAFTTIIDLPLMDLNETAQAVPYQARSLIPMSISDAMIDWTIIGQFNDRSGIKKQKLLLTSVPNTQVEAYKIIFKKAGLNLKLIEVEGISLARALTSKIKENVLILDIGAFTSAAIIAGEGHLKYSAQTDFAGNSLTQALAKGLGINVKRAEALKKQKGFAGMAGEYGLSTIMIPFIDVIINEGKKAKDLFEKENGKISKIILSGGGGGMIGLSEYIRKQLELETEIANPWNNISYPLHLSPLLQSVSSKFSVAVGIGIKPFL